MTFYDSISRFLSLSLSLTQYVPDSLLSLYSRSLAEKCDLSLVTDIVRGKILCRDISSLLAVLEALAALQVDSDHELRIRIVCAKNRLG